MPLPRLSTLGRLANTTQTDRDLDDKGSRKNSASVRCGELIAATGIMYSGHLWGS